MTDADDLARLCERLEKLATKAEECSPSPWSCDLDYSPDYMGQSVPTGLARVFDATDGPDYREICDYIDADTCEFVASCDPQTIISLIAALRRLQATLDTVTAERDELKRGYEAQIDKLTAIGLEWRTRARLAEEAVDEIVGAKQATEPTP